MCVCRVDPLEFRMQLPAGLGLGLVLVLEHVACEIVPIKRRDVGIVQTENPYTRRAMLEPQEAPNRTIQWSVDIDPFGEMLRHNTPLVALELSYIRVELQHAAFDRHNTHR